MKGLQVPSKLRKIFAGVMCLATFTSLFVAYMADSEIHHNVVQREINSSSALYRERAESNKAIRIEVITMRGCGPCQLLKQTTIPALRKAGYQVKVIDRNEDTRSTDAYPTIYYVGMFGNVTHIDVGYRTYNQVTRYLEKP